MIVVKNSSAALCTYSLVLLMIINACTISRNIIRVSSAPLSLSSSSSSLCVDDPDFRYKNVSKKSCEWLGTKSKKGRKKLCKKKRKVRDNCPLTCSGVIDNIAVCNTNTNDENDPPSDDKDNFEDVSIIISDPPLPVPVAGPCGCSTCTESVLDTFAGQYKCRDRINYLRYDMGFTEENACAKVAGSEYPTECGGCDPTKCNQNNNDNDEPSPPPQDRPQICGGAVNSSNDSNRQCNNDLWDPTGDSSMHCFAYGGSGDPCHLSNNNDPNDGLDKDPSRCTINNGGGDTFYLWDEPDTQGKSYEWAGLAWYDYSKKFSSELKEMRSKGIKVTSPLLKAGSTGVLKQNLDAFFDSCGSACQRQDDPAYIDVIAVNAFCGDFNGPSGCRGGAGFINDESIQLSTSYNNRPVYITNWSRLGTSNPTDQLDAIEAIDEFFPNDKNGVVERVYWFGATDYGGGSSNNFLVNTISDAWTTTLGEYWFDKCESLR